MPANARTITGASLYDMILQIISETSLDPEQKDEVRAAITAAFCAWLEGK